MERPSTTSASLVALFALAFFPLLAFCFFSEHQPVLPAACDEFGYLQLADAFDRGVAFDVHARRPFDDDLIPFLEAQGIAKRDFALMIAPHAYHFDEHAGHIVNQYPPATSYLLSWFAKSDRYTVFPPLCALLLVAPLLLVFWLRGQSPNYGFRIAAVSLTAGVCLFVPPLSSGFDVITSIGPTYGLLIAAGFLARRHPGAALALLGLTTTFRIGNVLLAAPLLAWFVYQGKARDSRPLIGSGVRAGLLFLGGGSFLYLGYVWAQLGNPLRSTYTRRDTAWSTIDGVADNLAFYFDSQAEWLWLHGVVFALLVTVSIGDRRMLRWALLSLTLPVLNYAFFVLHAMRIPYYPYASALMLIGILLDALDSHPALDQLRRQITTVAGFACLYLLPLIQVPVMHSRERFASEMNVHRETLANYDVVWAGLKSGTVEYTTGAAGFRYFYGPPAARVRTVQWLHEHGYRQAIWVDEPVFDRDVVIHDLESHGIPYVEQRTRLGPIIDIEPRR